MISRLSLFFPGSFIGMRMGFKIYATNMKIYMNCRPPRPALEPEIRTSVGIYTKNMETYEIDYSIYCFLFVCICFDMVSYFGVLEQVAGPAVHIFFVFVAYILYPIRIPIKLPRKTNENLEIMYLFVFCHILLFNSVSQAMGFLGVGRCFSFVQVAEQPPSPVVADVATQPFATRKGSTRG